ncbi:MAG: ABC transporter permease [Simkaniaceae bacterium]|nr:MAG: ABC transporter permease [Simkaniaceae bacterium]
MRKWIQFYGLFKREVARFFKVPLQTLGAPIVNSFLYLLIFGVSLGHSIHLENNLPYLAFLIPGLIAMSIIKNAFDNATSSIMGQKYVNELQDHRTAPLSLQQLCFARGFASLTRGLLVGLITFLVGQAFFFVFQGRFLIIYNPWIFIYFAVFGGLAFGNLGTAIGMWSKSFEHVGAVSMLVLLPLIYLGGVFFSLENAHSFWQTISHINPLYYIINGIRYGVLGTSDINFMLSASVTLAFFVVCYLFALMSLRKGSNYMR